MLFWMRRFCLYSCQSLDNEGVIAPLWFRRPLCGDVYTDYIVAATYFSILLYDYKSYFIIHPHGEHFTSRNNREPMYLFFVSNQQNDFIMILCGAGDKPISNWKSIKNILTESIFKSFCVYLCQFMYFLNQ